MLAAGMNVARFNFSHGSYEEHLEKMKTFREACRETGVPAAVLLDTKGPEIRLGAFAEGKVSISKGQKFVLRGSDEQPGTEEGVGISYKGLAALVSPGTLILIDDGKVRMEVDEVKDGDIICTSKDDGVLSTKKGVNVPDIHLDMDYLSEKDRADLLFGIENDVDFCSFLLEEAGVALMPGTPFYGVNRVRISYATSMQNLRSAMDIMEASLKQLTRE